MTDSTTTSAGAKTEATDNTNAAQAQPEYRSNVLQAEHQLKYDAAFSKDDEVWMKNPRTGIFEWAMIVVEAIYDERAAMWTYRVKTSKGRIYESLVPEGSLQD